MRKRRKGNSKDEYRVTIEPVPLGDSEIKFFYSVTWYGENHYDYRKIASGYSTTQLLAQEAANEAITRNQEWEKFHKENRTSYTVPA